MGTDVTSSIDVGGADKSSTRKKDDKKQDMINMVHIKQTERDQYFKALPGGHFYPVDEIPFHPEADEHGKVPWGSQLSGKLEDKKSRSLHNVKKATMKSLTLVKLRFKALKLKSLVLKVFS